jgi:hypothetical protein
MDDVLGKDLIGKIIIRSGYLDTDPKEICVITQHLKGGDFNTTDGYWLYPIAKIEKGNIEFIDSINRLREIDDDSTMNYRKINRKEKKLVQEFFEENPDIKEKIEQKVQIKL